MSSSIRSVIGVAAAVLAFPAAGIAQRPAKLGPARTDTLGTAIGRILGTEVWGIDVDVTDNGTPAQQNAKARKAAPKIVVLVRRYERQVAPGACHRSLHQLERAWVKGRTVTTKTATAFNRAYLIASQRVNDNCQ